MTRRGGAERASGGAGVGEGGDADSGQKKPKRGGARMQVVSRSADGPQIDARLLQFFAVSLESAAKSPETIKAYLLAVRSFVAFCAEQLDLPDVRVRQVRRHHIEAWQVNRLDRGTRTTASSYHAWLKAFWRWCVEVEYVEAPGPMAGVRQPPKDTQPRPVLRDDEIRKLIDACHRERSFFGYRDEALLRVLLDTGARRGGIARMRWPDLDGKSGIVRIHVKRGSAQWDVIYGRLGPAARRALERYRIEAEASPHYADDGPMWLGMQGPLTLQGIYEIVKRRGREAGLPDVFPHEFRHTFAHAFLASEGSERDLRALGGWRSDQAFHQYAAILDMERALEHKKGKSLSDRF